MIMSDGWLLDSTYIMPFFGINVDIPNINKDLTKILSQGSGKVFVTSCSLIEAKWKAIRNYLKSGDKSYLDRANNAFDSFQQNRYVKLIDAWFVRDASKWADQLLIEGHQNYMDCWIAGTAMAQNLILVSEDQPLYKLIKRLKSWKSFNCIPWAEFITLNLSAES